MLHYIRLFLKQNLLVILTIVIVSALQVGTNLVLIQIFQNIINFDLTGFLFYIVILLVLWLFILIINVAETFFEARTIRKMNNRVRQDIADSLVKKTYSDYHENTTGEYLSWFTNNINQIENLAWKPFYEFFKELSTVVFSIIALLMMHWSLLIASLLTTVIMFFVPNFFSKKMELLGQRSDSEQAAATGIIKEMLSGFDILRSFSRETQFLQKIKISSDRIEHSKFRLNYSKEITGAKIGCINIACQIMINVLIGFLSIRGIIYQGALMGGGNICGALSGGLGSLAQCILSFSASKPFFEKIDTSLVYGFDKESSLREFCDNISLENVSFSYGKTPVINRLSFSFKKGKKYAIEGPSGCGKTTILRLIMGWLTDYSGDICVDGDNVKNLSSYQLSHWMSYIEQDVFLFNGTILDNITLGEKFSEEQIQNALEESALKMDVDNFPDGINMLVGEEGANISGGQRQRVAIARALIHKRSILLIDEGTSALDKENANVIENNLLNNPNITLIMVSHHLSNERKKQFTNILSL